MNMSTPVLDRKEIQKKGMIITLKKNLMMSANQSQHISDCQNCLLKLAEIQFHAEHSTPIAKLRMLKSKSKTSLMEDRRWIKSFGIKDKLDEIRYVLKHTHWSYRYIARVLQVGANKPWELNRKENIR